MMQPHDYFKPIVEKQRKINRIGAIVMLAVFGGVAVWGLSVDPSQHPAARRAILGVLAVPVALGLLVHSFRRNRGLESLSDPSRIVWYYGVRKGGRVHRVMIGFNDGKLFSFQLPLISFKEGFSQEAFQHLKAAAPSATTGYSEDLRKAFKANPSSLRK